MSGNEADREKSAMKEVKAKTATERHKTPRPYSGKRTLCELSAGVRGGAIIASRI
jgi:hypothetical protein